MISYQVSGSTQRTQAFLSKMAKGDLYSGIPPLAQRGVDALKGATPRDSGRTADAWGYEIVNSQGSITIWWVNTNVINGFPVAIGLQYGHGTGNGGWIQGYDYINPALQAIFDEIAENVWKEVTKA